MRIKISLLGIALTTALAIPAHAQYLQVPQGAVVDNSLDQTMQPHTTMTAPMGAMHTQDAAAPMQASQKYETVSGGVTGEERAELDASQRGKSVKLVFAATNGEYLGDVMVTIKTAKGEEISNFKADGPYVFIALPAGTYSLTAVAGAETRTQKVTASKGQRAYTIRFSPQ